MEKTYRLPLNLQLFAEGEGGESGEGGEGGGEQTKERRRQKHLRKKS
ncbi:hypothetical protein P7H19_21610 [Paenibacillus larvae]|nr:hypothetical protein [Paenibacillus larvae]MDT2238351.1 hypothetical protein [Paenibacillus larvae]